jgi:anti-sigma B factor antagonist
VHVHGDLDVASGPALRADLLSLIEGGARDVIVDLSEVAFLDSSGLGVLITALKRLRVHGGTLRLAGCQPAVLRLLDLTALGRVFFVYPTVEDARSDLTEFGSPTPQ